MRVTVIGGAGAFGARLCVLLARDGHQVTVAGRDLVRAQAVAAQIGGQALRLDRRGDLAGLGGARVVIDAAGPFLATGDDPWRVARACIGLGVHYLDLSDNAAFTLGIGALDAAARAAGVAVLSGVSSVPALSSAAALALAEGLDRVEAIDSAILPGNRAPRGRAVVESILSNVGTSFAATEGGVPVKVRGWSRTRMFTLAPGLHRRGWMIEVPDQSLFPAGFGAGTVTFRAGMELGVMNWPLALWSWVRGVTGWPLPRGAVPVVMVLAQALAPFGTDRGGMVVVVTGRRRGEAVRRTWRLVAAGGDGPHIPGIAARALLRQPDLLTPGARPAVAVVPLALAEAAMADLRVTTMRQEESVEPLFRRALGADWARLPPAIRAGHDLAGPLVLRGEAEVLRGAGLPARLAAALFRFPPAQVWGPVSVTMTPQDGAEVWVRQFGRRRFRSHLTLRADGLHERFGPFRFRIGLRLSRGALEYPVTAGRFLGLPIPRALLPVSTTAETAPDGRFRFDVTLALPLGLGPVVRYRGWLAPVSAQPVLQEEGQHGL